jgi:hypothetical protein
VRLATEKRNSDQEEKTRFVPFAGTKKTFGFKTTKACKSLKMHALTMGHPSGIEFFPEGGFD